MPARAVQAARGVSFTGCTASSTSQRPLWRITRPQWVYGERVSRRMSALRDEVEA